MKPIDRLLPLLRQVKRTGPGRWMALCPTRNEKTPSLSIRERDDGALLLHDFGGASVQEILDVIGLDIAALFPPRPAVPGAGNKPERKPLIPADVFEIARKEIGIAAVVACDMHAKKVVSDGDHDRLLQAARTLDRIAEVAYATRP